MKSVAELMDLKGRVALITGGAGHIGSAMGEALAELGASIAVLDLSPEACAKIANQIHESYGVETLHWYKMLPEMGPPEITIYEYPGEDQSWEMEMQDWVSAIENGHEPCGSLEDAWQALRIVDQVYGKSES